MTAGPHHRDPRYIKLGARILALANANPDAVCWRDGLTLAEHQRRQPDRTHRWTRGHTRQGSRQWAPWWDVTTVPPPGDWLAPEVSTCNFRHGAADGNRQRQPRSSRHW